MNLLYVNIGLSIGILKKEELVNWADVKIEEGKIEEEFIEISLSKNLSNGELSNLLFNYSNEFKNSDKKLFHQKFISFIDNQYPDKNKDWVAIQKLLVEYNMVFYKNQDSEFWLRLKDDYELRISKLGGCMDMPNELIDFFCTFKNMEEKHIGNYLDYFYCFIKK